VDVFDILTVLIFLSDAKVLLDAVSRKEVDWFAFLENEMRVLKDEAVGSICNSSDRNPWYLVSTKTSLRCLMDVLSKDMKLHRVPVADGEGNIIGIITQSQVINFLYKNVGQFPDAAALKVKDRCLVFPPVVSVTAEETAIEAFKVMVTKKISGLAVIDSKGSLVGSLSATDLKGSLEFNLLNDLYLPVAMYLEKGTAEFDRKFSCSPISCTLETNIYELLHKLASSHIHRLFVIDGEHKPVGVLSLCDILSMMNSKLVCKKNE